MWKVYALMAIVCIVISILWVKGITDMHEKHPDYKGDDLFGKGFNFDDREEENDCDVTLADGLEEEKKDENKNIFRRCKNTN
jgi:hypothetical protein